VCLVAAVKRHDREPVRREVEDQFEPADVTPVANARSRLLLNIAVTDVNLAGRVTPGHDRSVYALHGGGTRRFANPEAYSRHSVRLSVARQINIGTNAVPTTLMPSAGHAGVPFLNGHPPLSGLGINHVCDRRTSIRSVAALSRTSSANTRDALPYT
jgi:hypothetical protein